MKKPITIHDIAEMANVSPATVSRVLSNSDYPVSKELQERIRRIAREVNYIPNLLGKQLKKNESTTIGVIIPSIVNPFYSFVILGIEEVARENDYTVMICNSLHDPELEQEYIRTMMQNQVKGLIISSISEDQALLQHCIDMGTTVIAIDQTLDELNVCQIKFDYRKGGYLGTKHLLDHGHKKIAYFTSKLDRPSRKSIYRGYLDAMEEAGLKAVLIESDEGGREDIYDFNIGKKMARKITASSQRPTAIFACNDLMAFGVISQLAQEGINVPQDISVIGFDGIDYGQMINPPLTTIKQPDYEMGKMSCRLLFDKIKNGETAAYDIILQPSLIERNSVLKL